MVREEALRKNRELFEQVRENMQGKKGAIPWYPEAYYHAKALLDREKNRISITISIR